MGTPVKWGHEFLVNTNSAYPSITALADGRFVVAWTGGDVSKSAIHAQLFNADGSKAGTEFLVNTTTFGNQLIASVTGLADGRFVVTWTDDSQSGGDTSSYAIRAQVFNADGSKAGTEFLVNTTTAGVQVYSNITALPDGRFVVTWRDDSHTGGDTSSYAIRAQVFNADGSKAGSEFLVNTTTFSHQTNSSITALTDGRFVVAWEDWSGTGGDTSLSAVRAQVFNADGSKAGTEFLVNTTTFLDQAGPSITALADGRFAVAWSDDSTGDMHYTAIHAQLFTADGSKTGAEFLVNTATSGYHAYPSITTLADGRFVVAWSDHSQTGGDTSEFAIRAQVFNADGSKTGTEFLVNTTTRFSQTDPSITALADGRFVVSWTDQSHATGVRARIFDPREAAINLTGGALSDDFIGTAFADTMNGRAGDDTLRGMAGDDHLAGQQGDDLLTGWTGNDALEGQGGADTLAPGGGDDTMTGGTGGDTFIFGKGSGHDIVSDFQNGKDVISLTTFGFASFAAAASHFTTSGADVIFTHGPVTLTIENFTLAQLSTADLIL